jgi:hypothetical protein
LDFRFGTRGCSAQTAQVASASGGNNPVQLLLAIKLHGCPEICHLLGLSHRGRRREAAVAQRVCRGIAQETN